MTLDITWAVKDLAIVNILACTDNHNMILNFASMIENAMFIWTLY